MSMIDNRIVKASFRENPVEERKLFPQSSCLMPISVGQAIHEDEKFAAVIKLINASFKQCTILVDDSVQRHTIGIMNHATTEELYQLAVKEGDEWLKRNQRFYKQLTIPFEIMRWDDWYNSPNYINSHLRVQKEYDTNKAFQNAIHANIDDFLTRYLSRFSPADVDHERAFRLCLDYLIEECSVMCLWTEQKYDFEVYPSGRNKAMAATYEFLIKPHHPNYLRPVALRFKKYPAKITGDNLNLIQEQVHENGSMVGGF
ncbi:tRNA-dependent cyclodipeptide synthase [Fluoribacter dumoffii]|uniref:Uncharacterized protein n=2 Tax=Fluoribacter dumoffii TaxID=463 RepID=A0A377GCR9_9GAMM|nr:hypothetical protein [Fluoribacter dumoffii]KTC90621.1 hypothetical protein Ldum_1689 [Fluoribacter dumoffii NY 23]MCW8386300.1 tRNA-dependent cyclodipeptide synthase [Fluoribacter dumoffii]MCW8419353.1 tRNA-dependent cyclodipeptide synthase [Fluoribacter dumoffii]MCW8452772.1 tRNA-dependent cyclodipeptide synthase [Fluoribacter dumoffii]MCW8459978.1 tRNA-dependent cyclodipeptide synthase [Fluoribacter dumoffii]